MKYTHLVPTYFDNGKYNMSIMMIGMRVEYLFSSHPWLACNRAKELWVSEQKCRRLSLTRCCVDTDLLMSLIELMLFVVLYPTLNKIYLILGWRSLQYNNQS